MRCFEFYFSCSTVSYKPGLADSDSEVEPASVSHPTPAGACALPSAVPMFTFTRMVLYARFQ